MEQANQAKVSPSKDDGLVRESVCRRNSQQQLGLEPQLGQTDLPRFLFSRLDNKTQGLSLEIQNLA